MRESKGDKIQSILTEICEKSSDIAKIDRIRDRIAAIGKELVKIQAQSKKR